MDLILAHKRSMKFAEMAGLSLSAQTSFATAVSEVARNAIESNKKSHLILILDVSERTKYIVARLTNQHVNSSAQSGLEYAKKLVNKYQVSVNGAEASIELFYSIPSSFKTDLQKLDEWRSTFRNEPPISPYDEIKRKIDQLQDLSDKLQKSEAQYKILTNSLPIIIFTLDKNGDLLFGNEWLVKYTGESIQSLNQDQWKNIVHPADYDAFRLLLKSQFATGATAVKTQTRLKHKDAADFFWHQISITPFRNEAHEMEYWIGFMVDINAQKVFEETLKDNAELKEAQKQLEGNQQILEKYIEELNRSNSELQQFAFIASHDLQEPVRKLLFYSDYFLTTYAGKLEGRSNDFLMSMQLAAQRMRNLIQDLLLFSQINKSQANFSLTDLNEIMKDALQDLEISIEEKKAVINLEPLPVLHADERMMRQLFENIIGNSLKYSEAGRPPVINITSREKNGYCEITFSDNGIGFDEKYIPQIFTLFQRLHSREHYNGTGLGLAICVKIVEMHGGRIWAESKEGEGASFFVSLPMPSNN